MRCKLCGEPIYKSYYFEELECQIMHNRCLEKTSKNYEIRYQIELSSGKTFDKKSKKKL